MMRNEHVSCLVCVLANPLEPVGAKDGRIGRGTNKGAATLQVQKLLPGKSSMLLIFTPDLCAAQ